MSNLMYLAGPVDRAQGAEWRREARSIMSRAENWITYDPVKAWHVGPEVEIDNKIAHVNRLALHVSAAVVAHLPDEPTAGTFMEIAWAERLGIPVAWFGDAAWDAHWSLALSGIQRVPDLESAIAWAIGHARNDQGRELVSSTLHVQKLSTNAILPAKSHDDDAGWDLYCAANVIVQPGKWEDVPIGIAIQPPPGIWFRIVGRSSTFRQRRILVLEGIIDEGYRGPLFVGCTNLGDEDVEIKAGERICQMLPQYTLSSFAPRWTVELAESARGPSGFGSTGT